MFKTFMLLYCVAVVVVYQSLSDFYRSLKREMLLTFLQLLLAHTGAL